MGTIALGVVYLASPVATTGTPVVGIEAPSVIVPAPIEAAPPPIAKRDYVVFDMPAASRLRVTFLTREAVNEADTWKADRPGAVSHPWRWEAVGKPDGSDVAGPSSTEDVDDAVVAAHAQRVSLLRQRLATLAPGTATAQSDELRGRLRRAEAARKLAVARLSIATVTAAIDAGAGATASAGSMLRRDLDGGRRTIAIPDAARVSGDRRRASAAAAQPTPIGRAGVHRSVSAAPIASVAKRLPHAASQTRRLALRMEQARRSLALARRALEVQTDDPTPVRPAPAPGAPAMLQWPGSATWTLAAFHSWR